MLARDELRSKLGLSLGDTLSHKFGVSQSSFGAGASRPIIRGLEGPRVKALQNGMDVADVSTISNDHAVSTDTLRSAAYGPSGRATARESPSRSRSARPSPKSYSDGPHESTATFDIGDSALDKETSRNIEPTLQKTEGKMRWKVNLFRNRFSNFIYGRATIRGAEGEVSYNLHGDGFSARGYADTSRGTLDGQGGLPPQPATRAGLDLGYRQQAWRGGVSLLHALRQSRLASFESMPTPAYTRRDADLSYTQRYGMARVAWFAVAKNLLNQGIRVSTSLLKDMAPLPGRNLVVGVRTSF